MPLTDDEKARLDAYMGVAKREDEAATASAAALNSPAVTSALGSMIAPTAAQLGTEGALALAGVPEAGLVPMGVRALVAGIMNTGTSKLLPESLGGQPNAPVATDFAWGAVPEVLSAGAQTALRGLANRNLRNAAGAYGKEGRELLDPENLTVQQALLASPAKPLFGPGLGIGTSLERTNQLQQARQPLQQMMDYVRNKHGRPIGDAYRSLKGAEPLTEEATDDLIAGADKVVDSLVAPGPLTRRYAQQIKSWSKPEEEPLEPLKGFQVTPGQLAQQAKDPAAKAHAAALANQQWQPPTLDRLRDLRQQINLDLQHAKGGDRYGLGMLQDRLDEELMDHLPANMDEMRRQYRGIIKRWGYQREYGLETEKDPQAIIGDVFKHPADAAELYTEAGTPAQRDQIRSYFVQHVWGGMDPNMSAKDQAALVRKRLVPYMFDERAARAMMGDQPAKQIQQIMAWSKYAPDLDQQLRKNPAAKAAFEANFRAYFLRRGLKPQEAATAAMSKLMTQIPGATPQTAILENTPWLPAAHAPTHSMANVLAARHGTLAGLHLLTGNVAWGALQASEAITWLSGGHGFAASMRFPNATRYLLNAFDAGSPGKAGWRLARAFDLITHGSAQTLRANAEPVEME